MSLPTLLTVPGDDYAKGAFAFDHAMAHRANLGAMTPLDHYSVVPYVLDPQMLQGGGWLMNHQQAHQDFRINLPVLWGRWYIGDQQYAISSSQNLQDADLTDSGQMTWWTFVNHHDHLIAAELLPQQIELVYPFW